MRKPFTGSFGILLGQAGRKLDDKTAYGLWDWDKI